MNILFLTDNFPPEKNAAAARVFERACYWVKWGHAVTILTCAPNFPEGKVYPGYENRWRHVETMEGMRVVRVKSYIAPDKGAAARSLDFLSFMFTAFGAGMFEKRPDVVVSTSPQFFTAVAGWALGFARRIPFVFELGDLWPATIVAVGAIRANFGLRMMEKLELFLYRQSARVVALTNAFRDDLIRRGIPPSKIDVVINGVDLARFAPQPRDAALRRSLDIPADAVVFGYLGTLGLSHGLENVIAAAAKLGNPKARILFVGGGMAKAFLEEETKKLGLPNIIFVPPQPKERIMSYWSICDAALIHLKDAPVFQTVIPSKSFEAMAMGLPLLLVAPEGEATTLIRDNHAGLTVPAAAPDQLAATIERLASDPELRSRLASAALQAAPRYSRERQAREMLDALGKAVR